MDDETMENLAEKLPEEIREVIGDYGQGIVLGAIKEVEKKLEESMWKGDASGVAAEIFMHYSKDLKKAERENDCDSIASEYFTGIIGLAEELARDYAGDHGDEAVRFANGLVDGVVDSVKEGEFGKARLYARYSGEVIRSARKNGLGPEYVPGFLKIVGKTYDSSELEKKLRNKERVVSRWLLKEGSVLSEGDLKSRGFEKLDNYPIQGGELWKFEYQRYLLVNDGGNCRVQFRYESKPVIQ